MITKVIEILTSREYQNVSEAVDIAKGRDKTPKTWKDFKKWFKRNAKWPRKY